MVKVTRLRSWNTNADNLEEMVTFYREILGATVDLVHTIGGAQVARLSLGTTGIGIFDASDGPRPGIPHHTFEIDGQSGPEALVRELEGKGVKVDGTRQHGDGPGYSVYIDDPSGNRIELSYDPA